MFKVFQQQQQQQKVYLTVHNIISNILMIMEKVSFEYEEIRIISTRP